MIPILCNLRYLFLPILVLVIQDESYGQAQFDADTRQVILEGNVIGHVVGGDARGNGGRAVDFSNPPRSLGSAPYNITYMTSTGNSLYIVSIDGVVTAVSNPPDEDDDGQGQGIAGGGLGGVGNGGSGSGGGQGVQNANGGDGGQGGTSGVGVGGGGSSGTGNGGSQGQSSDDHASIDSNTNPYAQGGASEGVDSAALVLGAIYSRISDRGSRIKHNTLGTDFDSDTGLIDGFSPIVHDLRNPERENRPELMDGDVSNERPTMAKAYGYNSGKHSSLPKMSNISVDRELMSTTFLSAMSFDWLTQNYADSDPERYVNLIKSKLGVANTTIAYLDKTIAAALVATKQQADSAGIGDVMGQVSFATDHMANHDAGIIFDHRANKLRECFNVAIQNQGIAKQQVKGLTMKRVDFQCSERCKDLMPKQAQSGQDNGRLGDPFKAGSYRYCICCAGQDPKLNKFSEDGSKPVNLEVSDKEHVASYMELAYRGVGKIDSKIIEQDVAISKLLFGDIVLVSEESENGGEPAIHKVFQLPGASINRVVAAYLNKCAPLNLNQPLITEGNCTELADQLHIKYGSLVALMKISENWELITGSADDSSQEVSTRNLNREVLSEFPRWLAEASMGVPVTGRLIKELLSINGDPVSKLVSGQETGRGSRTFEILGMNKAFAATVRLFALKAAEISDHLVLSQQLTGTQKGELLQLVNRQTQALALAQADYDASYAVKSANTATAITYDRRQTASMASVAQTMINIQDTVARASGYTSFGGATQFCDGGDCSSLGGIAGGTQNSKLLESENSSKMKHETTSAAYEDIPLFPAELQQELDPISQTVSSLRKRK